MDQDKACQLYSSKTRIAVLVIVIIMVGLYAFPLLLSTGDSFTLYPKNIPSYWYSSYAGEFIFVESIFKLHPLLLWTPLIEGGRFLMRYPLSITPFPLRIFSLIFGEIYGIKISFFLFFIFGACSMYYLTNRVLKYSIFGSIFASFSFAMSGAFAYLFENGFLYFREVLLLPLLVAFFIKAKENYTYIILCSFILSLMLIHTALFSSVITIFLLLFAGLDSFNSKNKRYFFNTKPIKTFIIVCILAFLFSAFKIFPLAELLLENNRASGLQYVSTIRDANTFQLFFKRIFTPANLGPGTMYLGFMPVALCLLSVIFYFKRVKDYFIILILFIIFSFGPNSPLDLHRLLWHLPVFSSIIEISKYYAVIISFIITLLAGQFFSVFENQKKRVLAFILPIIIILYTYFNLFNSNIGHFNVFNTKLNRHFDKKEFFQIKGLNIHRGDESIISPLFYFLAKKGIGLITFPDFRFRKDSRAVPKYFLLPKYAFLIPSTALLVLPNPAYKGEAYFFNDKNKVKKIEFLPNSVSIEVHLVSPDRLIINQNFDKYWKSNYGTVEDYNGLLSVNLDTVKDPVIYLTYFPQIFFIGLIITLVSISYCCYMLVRNKLGK